MEFSVISFPETVHALPTILLMYIECCYLQAGSKLGIWHTV